ncbi:MAG: sulfotransferase [Nocardioidaceae bacterium]
MDEHPRDDHGVESPHAAPRVSTLINLTCRGVIGDVREQRRRRTAGVKKRPRRPPQRMSPRVSQPVFLLGSPRSGTTFLGECVASAPSISYHFEPRLTKAAARFVYDDIWSPSRARKVFRSFYGLLLLANGDGGSRFAEKNPENCFIVDFLAQTFPDALFVHIVRDGRDAAVSHAEKPWLRSGSERLGRHGRGGTAWGPTARFWVESQRREEFATVTDLERTAWAWRRFSEAAVTGLDQLPSARWLRVRYEKVVSDPGASAEELGAFLNFTSHDIDALHMALASAVDTSVGRWKAALSPEQVAAVSQQCGPLLMEWGYQ